MAIGRRDWRFFRDKELVPISYGPRVDSPTHSAKMAEVTAQITPSLGLAGTVWKIHQSEAH